jgi:hypothetical protein
VQNKTLLCTRGRLCHNTIQSVLLRHRLEVTKASALWSSQPVQSIVFSSGCKNADKLLSEKTGRVKLETPGKKETRTSFATAKTRSFQKVTLTPATFHGARAYLRTTAFPPHRIHLPLLPTVPKIALDNSKHRISPR